MMEGRDSLLCCPKCLRYRYTSTDLPIEFCITQEDAIFAVLMRGERVFQILCSAHRHEPLTMEERIDRFCCRVGECG